MKKSITKNSRKLKQRKQKIAVRARKTRKNNKQAINISVLNKTGNLIFIKKNLLPAVVLTIGCFIFYLSNSAQSSALQTLENMQANAQSSISEQKINNKNEKTITKEKNDSLNTEELRAQINQIVNNTPMEAMVEDITQRDRVVAAYLVGIAMKESKYGIYSPKKDGTECFNYWGYRGKENKTKSGYSCFNSPEHAVQVVGDRIKTLINYGRNTPEEMVVWKCGYSCDGHSDESVAKWIADVSINYYKLNPEHLLTKK